MINPIFYVRKDGLIEFQITRSKRRDFLNIHYPLWQNGQNNPYSTGMFEDWSRKEIALLVFATNRNQYQEFLEWLQEE